MGQAVLPQVFVMKRVHSLLGFFLVLFLLEHLLTNAEAGFLLFGDVGTFIKMVNGIHDLPYVRVLEIVLIGAPFLFHGVIGVRLLFTAKINTWKTDGSSPSLSRYARNQGYSWQRITSWILLILILYHVIDFRFIRYPKEVSEQGKSVYFVAVTKDSGLELLESQFDLSFYDKEMVENNEQNDSWTKTLRAFHLTKDRVVVRTESFGIATLLTVRDTFKNPLYVVLYTVFVLAASFHAFNGLWTFLITWGLMLSMAAQKRAGRVTLVLMGLIICLGLFSIWGPYFTHLLQRV